ncbi:FAD-dependent oxidoreductase [Acrocarpospora macrocephala]|uniref:Pyridine nucleotide-disulfide oxidoreductase n=1 Tax=Acrocarpospora macrocephala TaxID=150177 RepID=A0A5M3WTX5_9ACTN|nr:FAD-dependent oxidoreductase [Acrocarpospora macrocephala]GES09588.1 pyridine nucleotide-disulfide oxidoreductase [Acrocarpospora macrocephala]
MSVVIAGGGAGGLRMTEALRQRGYTGPVTVVGAEAHLPYNRPGLSKELLRGDEDGIWLGEPDADVVLADPATAVDTDRNELLLNSGRRIAYTDLVLATGAEARRLPMVAAEAHRIRGLDDAVALREDLRKGGHLLVIGGGFVGCEVASTARTMGLGVTVVEVLDHLAEGALGPAVGAYLSDLHRSHGVRLLCGRTVVSANRLTDGTWLVALADGTELTADHVVEGSGSIPATGWLEGGPFTLDSGVVCDDRGRTNIPHVYALGDVARWWHPAHARHLRMEHWTSVTDQAAVVADTILGTGDRPLEPVPYFWSDQYGVRLQAIGLPGRDDEVTVLRNGTRGSLLGCYSRDGRLTGVVGVREGKAVARLRLFMRDAPTLADALAHLSTKEK